MQNRPKRFKIILIFILFVDSRLINYGSCAPRISQLENNDSEKVKRSAGFMNYLSSIFCSRTSFNYPDSSWNSYEPSPQLPPLSPGPSYEVPGPTFEANFQYQYLDESGNKDQDENYINWPENDVKKISYFETIPKDVPVILTNLGKDNSFTYILGNDCDYDQNSVDNDLNWDLPSPGIDEGMFHNFYLIPEERDFSRDSAPTTTTTEKPIEESIQNQNKAEEEEKSPNITIFNCSSSPYQKEFLEKVLNDNNDEYLVLLIKRNPFLRAKEEENKTEIVLQSPPDSKTEFEARWKNTTSSIVEIQEDVTLKEENKSNVNKETSQAPVKVENKITGIVGMDLKIAPKPESSTEMSSSTVPTSIKTQENAEVTIQLNKSKESITRNNDKTAIMSDIDMDLKEISITESSITIASSTISPPIAIQEQVVKMSFQEENENNLAIESQKESNKLNIKIPNEGSSNIQTVQIVENQISAETVNKTRTSNDIPEYKLKTVDKPYNDIDTGSVKENKVLHEETLNTNSEAKMNILVESLQGQQDLELVDDFTSVKSINDVGISNANPSSTTPSQIENIPLQAEESSKESFNNSKILSSESLGLLEDSIVSVTSNYLQSNEDQKTFLKPLEISLTEATTKIEEDIKPEESNLDFISRTTTNPIDNLGSTYSELT